MMRRVIIIGSAGAGKSTLALRLGPLLGLPVIHLDREHWRPGWVETPKPEWRARVEALTRRPTWVIEGNYSGTLDVRVAACDTVVFLDYPRLLCLWGIVRRVLFRGPRPDMAPGCPERVDLEFALWVWRYPRRTRPKVLELLAQHPGRTIVHLRSRAETEAFLAQLV